MLDTDGRDCPFNVLLDKMQIRLHLVPVTLVTLLMNMENLVT